MVQMVEHLPSKVLSSNSRTTKKKKKINTPKEMRPKIMWNWACLVFPEGSAKMAKTTEIE
jgi:hypothetical protein